MQTSKMLRSSCTDVSCRAYNSLAFLRLSPTGNPLPTPSDFDGAMSGGHRVTRVTYEGSCPTGGAIDSVRLVHMQMSAPLATHLLTPHVTSHHSLGASVASNAHRQIRLDPNAGCGFTMATSSSKLPPCRLGACIRVSLIHSGQPNCRVQARAQPRRQTAASPDSQW